MSDVDDRINLEIIDECWARYGKAVESLERAGTVKNHFAASQQVAGIVSVSLRLMKRLRERVTTLEEGRKIDIQRMDAAHERITELERGQAANLEIVRRLDALEEGARIAVRMRDTLHTRIDIRLDTLEKLAMKVCDDLEVNKGSIQDLWKNSDKLFEQMNLLVSVNTLANLAAPAPSSRLTWDQHYDGKDRTYYEAASPYSEGFMWRLRTKKGQWVGRHDAELMNDETRGPWPTLDMAKAAIQRAHDEILADIKAEQPAPSSPAGEAERSKNVIDLDVVRWVRDKCGSWGWEQDSESWYIELNGFSRVYGSTMQQAQYLIQREIEPYVQYEFAEDAEGLTDAETAGKSNEWTGEGTWDHCPNCNGTGMVNSESVPSIGKGETSDEERLELTKRLFPNLLKRGLAIPWDGSLSSPYATVVLGMLVMRAVLDGVKIVSSTDETITARAGKSVDGSFKGTEFYLDPIDALLHYYELAPSLATGSDAEGE